MGKKQYNEKHIQPPGVLKLRLRSQYMLEYGDGKWAERQKKIFKRLKDNRIKETI